MFVLTGTARELVTGATVMLVLRGTTARIPTWRPMEHSVAPATSAPSTLRMRPSVSQVRIDEKLVSDCNSAEMVKRETHCLKLRLVESPFFKHLYNSRCVVVWNSCLKSLYILYKKSLYLWFCMIPLTRSQTWLHWEQDKKWARFWWNCILLSDQNVLVRHVWRVFTQSTTQTIAMHCFRLLL